MGWCRIVRHVDCDYSDNCWALGLSRRLGYTWIWIWASKQQDIEKTLGPTLINYIIFSGFPFLFL